MRTLGIRCSNTDYTYCVLEMGAEIKIESISSILFPRGYSEPEIYQWINQEISDLSSRWSFDAVVLKMIEFGVSRNKALDLRLGCEAIIVHAAFSSGCKKVLKKGKSTIAKDLGLKGTGKALKTDLDTSKIPGYTSYTAKEQEAILCAWSENQ